MMGVDWVRYTNDLTGFKKYCQDYPTDRYFTEHSTQYPLGNSAYLELSRHRGMDGERFTISSVRRYDGRRFEWANPKRYENEIDEFMSKFEERLSRFDEEEALNRRQPNFIDRLLGVEL